MQQFKSLKPAALWSVLALATLPAAPASAQDSGWYVGANGGVTQAAIDKKGIREGLLEEGLATEKFREDTEHFGYKVFTGYQLTPMWSLEAGYFDLGKFGFTATTLPAGTLEEELSVRGFNADVVFTLPVSEELAFFARAGANYAEAEVSFAGSGAVAVLERRRSERGTNLKFGFGAQYALSDSLALRAEAERYRIDDAVGNLGDIDLYSVGIVYRFDR